MPKIVELPRLSDTMEEGAVAKWHVAEGDKVKRGQVIADIETDKATMEFESFDAGTVLKIVAEEGDTLSIGSVIAVLGKPGEDAEAALAGHTPSEAAEAPAEAAPAEAAPAPAPASSPAPASPPAPAPARAIAANEAPAGRTDERIAASPLARRLAREYGLDLARVQGTGPHGRIVKTDVEAARAGGGVAASPAIPAGVPSGDADGDGRPYVEHAPERIKLTQMRKTIARRMSESFRDIPHFYLSAVIEMDRVVAMRAELKEALPDRKVSFNDIIILAVARALREHPRVNRHFDGDAIVQPGGIHVGVAVAIDDGLIVPVVRHTDQKRLTDIAAEVRDLAGRAQTKTLRPEEMTGSTFTVSNLGMFGIDHFMAVINPGEGAILAIGGISDVAKPDGKGGFRAAKHMKVTLACDHRAMDGADGAKFLATLTAMLQRPMSLFA